MPGNTPLQKKGEFVKLIKQEPDQNMDDVH
jgi:hypothetical protein